MPASLETYRKKRSFERTREPRGEVRAGNGFSFVVQKHAASRLHYDFRLELDGVLLSWAVPKGPSLDPSVKRLAMQTEDHPVEYGGFEGIIPQGEYGGGTVMVWDRGRWVPEGDPREAYARGNLKFRLEGEKLRGSWHLVRTKGRRADERASWLLFKGSDGEASKTRDVAAETKSVLSGRELEEIAAAADQVWSSNHEVAQPKRPRRPATPAAQPSLASVAGARREPFPLTPLEPQLATLTDEVPSGDEWFHEIKLDGYRFLAHVDGQQVRLDTRRGLDWSERFPEVVEALAAANLGQAVLDGEMVMLDERGISDFQALQNALDAPRRGRAAVFFVFDLLYLDGWDLSGAALEARKGQLRELIAGHFAANTSVRYCDHLVGHGEDAYRQACKMGLEGIVCKRRNAPYQAGRSTTWLKAKCSARQEFVVGGYSDPGGSREHFGALLLGVYQDGKLRYAGKTGTGFTDASLAELHARLAPLEQPQPPFADPPRGAEARGVHWLRPELVAEVAFAGFTSDGRARQAVFHGLREDKPAREVVPEAPAEAPVPASGPAVDGISHPDRVVYPDRGITKGQVAEYYRRVSELMLPHVLGRPLTLVRCPDGQPKACFYQKHAWPGLGPGLVPVELTEEGEPATYVAVASAEGLLSLVQFGVLEVHVWGSRAEALEAPDRVVLDLDPGPDVAFAAVVAAAQEVRDRVQKLGLRCFVKSTGGKGLHVVVPVTSDARRFGWDQAKAFGKALALAMEADDPRRYLSVASKAKRKGKIYVDYLRNARGATAVAAYSTRARPGAPIAVPLAWEELASFDPATPMTLEGLTARLSTGFSDPWRELPSVRQRLPSELLGDGG